MDDLITKAFSILFSIGYVILAALVALSLGEHFNLSWMESFAIGVVFLFALSIVTALPKNSKRGKN